MSKKKYVAAASNAENKGNKKMREKSGAKTKIIIG